MSFSTRLDSVTTVTDPLRAPSLSLSTRLKQEEKVYVQHKLVEQGAKVSEWLSEAKGGYLYICG